MNTREVVLTMLTEILEEDKQSHLVISRSLLKYRDADKKDRAFMQRLCEGTIEHLMFLDYDIERFSKVKVRKMKPIIRNILRMGMYQIKYMSNVPASAACNEAVKLAKAKGFQGLSGFVNGVLRNAARNKETLFTLPDSMSKEEKLSIRYSIPLWMVKDFLKRMDYETTEQMLKTFEEPKKMTVRVNESRIGLEEFDELLKKEGITVNQAAYVKEARYLSDFDSLFDIPAFRKGYFAVQDESSMLTSIVADPDKDDYVIDVCSAPGGKALHLAEILTRKQDGDKKASGFIDARDKTEYKVSLINENISRLGYTNIKASVQDALELDEESIGKADVVIADLPCSGLGVIGRKPDIRQKMTKETEESIVTLQRQILDVVHQYVKPGGTLIFSTCTINTEENEENVSYITNKLGLLPESLDAYLPESLHSETTKKGYLQLIPGVHQTDGFFISRFRKIKE